MKPDSTKTTSNHQFTWIHKTRHLQQKKNKNTQAEARHKKNPNKDDLKTGGWKTAYDHAQTLFIQTSRDEEKYTVYKIYFLKQLALAKLTNSLNNFRSQAREQPGLSSDLFNSAATFF